jgi:hypothetical protein
MQDHTPFARSTSTTTEPMSPNAVSEEAVRGRNISCCLLASAASTSTLAATTITNTKKKIRCQAQIHSKKSQSEKTLPSSCKFILHGNGCRKGETLIATSSLSRTSSIAEISTQIRQKRQQNRIERCHRR